MASLLKGRSFDYAAENSASVHVCAERLGTLHVRGKLILIVLFQSGAFYVSLVT